MKLRASILFYVTVVATVFSCGDRGGSPPVPRPTAYPRAVDPGVEYISADSLPIIIEVNSSAVISHPAPDWVDIAYPDLRATIHLSVIHTSPEDIGNIIANRSERIALNLADAAPTARDLTLESDDFISTLVVAPDARTTPLQFLATDDNEWVITGSAFFSGVGQNSSVDSLSQSVDFIRRDIEHALTSLARK